MHTEFSEFDKACMKRALANAEKAQELGEVPVGAVLTIGGETFFDGFNQPISCYDPTAHAEIQALRQACTAMKNYRLPNDACLYVTLEPCTMCIGALIHARLPRLVFATTEPRAGAVVSQKQLLDETHYNHQVDFAHGLFAEQSAQLLKQFFRKKRNKSVKSESA